MEISRKRDSVSRSPLKEVKSPRREMRFFNGLDEIDSVIESAKSTEINPSFAAIVKRAIKSLFRNTDPNNGLIDVMFLRVVFAERNGGCERWNDKTR